MFEELYKQELLDHYHHPQNHGTIDNPDFLSEEYNPSCGDQVIIQGTLNKKGIIQKLVFRGAGCVISQAAASMLTEWCKEKQITDVLQYTAKDMTKLINISVGPTRLKCVLLALYALQHGIVEYQKKL